MIPTRRSMNRAVTGLGLLLLSTPPATAQGSGLVLDSAVARSQGEELLGELGNKDRFGRAMAVGDFDGDGVQDLAVGVASDRVDGVVDAGVVNIVFGSEAGLSPRRDMETGQTAEGEGDDLLRPGHAAETGEQFGWAVAAGNFDCRGGDELAVSAPWRDVGSVVDAGSVHVFYFSERQIEAEQVWHQAIPHVAGRLEAHDAFGEALESGDFDGDTCDDLAIGIPFEDIDDVPNAGAVQVLYGSVQGLTHARNQFWSQGSFMIEDRAEAGDHFGRSLASGDFDGDLIDDLAVGVPREDVVGISGSGGPGTLEDAGAVNVLYGVEGEGLGFLRSEFFHQNTCGFPGEARPREQFGFSLAAGDFDGAPGDFDEPRAEDLAIGIPWEDIRVSAELLTQAGAVTIAHGTGRGLSNCLTVRTWFVFEGDDPALQRPSPWVSQTEENFGFSLAAGNFDGQGADDLAIGSPAKNVRVTDGRQVFIRYDAGSALVLYGVGDSGLSTQGNQLLNQENLPSSRPEDSDRFGYALAAGDFNGDSCDDLVVGTPFKDSGGFFDAGIVEVVYGSGGDCRAPVDLEPPGSEPPGPSQPGGE